MEIPEVDSDGALVLDRDKVVIRGLYQDDFSRVSVMALVNVNMSVEIISKDAVAVVEYDGMFENGDTQMVRKDLLSLSREEVSEVFTYTVCAGWIKH